MNFGVRWGRGAFALLLLISVGGTGFADALICNCTHNTQRSQCRDRTCEALDNAACIMIEHPTSGRHYTCSTAHLPDGECMEKVTNAGARVIVCSCNSTNYCSHKFWPPFMAENTSEDEDYMEYIKNYRVATRAVTVESLQKTNAAPPRLRCFVSIIAAIIAHTSILLFKSLLLQQTFN